MRYADDVQHAALVLQHQHTPHVCVPSWLGECAYYRNSPHEMLHFTHRLLAIFCCMSRSAWAIRRWLLQVLKAYELRFGPTKLAIVECVDTPLSPILGTHVLVDRSWRAWILDSRLSLSVPGSQDPRACCIYGFARPDGRYCGWTAYRSCSQSPRFSLTPRSISSSRSSNTPKACY
jgi:hypothetical protein